MVIRAVGDREFGSAGEPGEVAGRVPGVPNYSAGNWESRGVNGSGDLVGYLRTAFGAESGVGRAVKCRGRVEAFGRLPWLGKSRGGLRRSSEWLGAALRFGEYLPSRRGATSVFGRAREHLSILTAVAV